MVKILLSFLWISGFAFSQEEINWFPFQEENGTWTFRSENGKQLGDFYFDTVAEFEKEGLSRVRIGNKWGVVNDSAKWVIQPIFDKIRRGEEYDYSPQHSNFWMVMSLDSMHQETWGIYQLKGRMIVPCLYSFISLDERIFLAASYGEEGVLLYNYDGKQLSPLRFKPRYEHYGLGAKETIDGQLFYINEYGVLGQTVKGNKKAVFAHKHFIYDTENGEMLIAYTGDTIIQPGKYHYDFYENRRTQHKFIAVQDSTGLWGIIDLDGKILVEPKLAFKPTDFNPLKGGYYNTNAVHDRDGYFKTGPANVFFDRNGDIVKFKDAEIVFCPQKAENDLYIAERNSKQGMIARSGETIIPFEYISILDMINAGVPAFIATAEDKKKILFDINGKQCIPGSFLSIGHPPASSLQQDVIYFLEQDSTYDIYNFTQQKFVLREISTKPIRNYGYYFWPQYKGGGPGFIIFIDGKGWMEIDSAGNFVADLYSTGSLKVMGSDLLHQDTLNGRFVRGMYLENGIKIPTVYQLIQRNYTEGVIPGLVLASRYDGKYDLFSENGIKRDEFFTKHEMKTRDFKFYSIVTNARGAWLLNTLLKPVNKHYFDSIQGILYDLSDNDTEYEYEDCLQGIKNGNHYILYMDGRISKAYDTIFQQQKDILYILARRKEKTDLYNLRGELMFSGIDSYKEFKSYIVVQKRDKEYWITASKKIYMVKKRRKVN